MKSISEIVKGLECCCQHIVGMSCGNCPYNEDMDITDPIDQCQSELAYDALQLFKQQITCCKDCVHSEPFEDDESMIWCNIHEFGRTLNYYCGDAITKE